MAVLKGTQLASLIVPGTTEDEYPTHDAKYGKGGFRAVGTIEESNLIPSPRLDPGMFVYVIDPGELYVYEVNNDIGSWVLWEGSGGGSGESSYTESFTNQTDITIEHNLGRYPSITIKDSEDDVIVGEANYIDEDNIRLTFSEAVSGTVYLI